MSHLEKLNARYNQIQGLLNTIEAAAREVSAEARKKTTSSTREILYC